MILPDCDTLATAYPRAQEAQRRGISSIDIIANAEGRRGKPRGYVQAWSTIPGIRGWIVNRYADEDGVIERLRLRVEVVDIISAYTDQFIADTSDPVRPRRPRGVRLTR